MNLSFIPLILELIQIHLTDYGKFIQMIQYPLQNAIMKEEAHIVQ